MANAYGRTTQGFNLWFTTNQPIIVNPKAVENIDKRIIEAIKDSMNGSIDDVRLELGIDNDGTGSPQWDKGEEVEIDATIEVTVEADAWNTPEVRWLSNGDPGYPGDSGYEIIDGEVTEVSEKILRDKLNEIPELHSKIDEINFVIDRPNDDVEFCD